MIIQSSLSDAQYHASNFKSSSNVLSGINQAQEDSLTTVSGNSNAHDSLNTAQTSRQAIAAAVDDMVSNLNSVAADFEAVDQKVAATID